MPKSRNKEIERNAFIIDVFLRIRITDYKFTEIYLIKITINHELRTFSDAFLLNFYFLLYFFLFFLTLQ